MSDKKSNISMDAAMKWLLFGDAVLAGILIFVAVATAKGWTGF